MESKVKKGLRHFVITGGLLLSSTALFAQGENFDMGFGIGIPYGIFGVNAEYYPINNLSLSAGLGSTLRAGAGYDIGIQYYFAKKGDNWSPRLSAHYGTNGILQTTLSVFGTTFKEDYESFEGLSVGVGFKNMMGNSGWTFDILYVVSSGLFDRIDELEAQGFETSSYGPERFWLGFGYTYSF